MPMNCEMNSLSSLSSKFSDLKVIAGGGGGVVLSGVDKSLSESSLSDKDGSAVALKRLSLVGKGHCRVALRELRLLKRFQHENVVKTFKITDSNGSTIDDPSLENFKDLDSVYVVEELLDTDLHKVIDRNGRLSLDTTKLFLYQLLRGLKYIHSANVIHRDIKPGNLFVNGDDLTLKIGDYGLARVFDQRYEHRGYLTAVVSTRYYRAPEVMINLGNYSYAIDMWSTGCVFAEMLLGKVMFSGENDLDQLNVICSAFGLNVDNIYKEESSFPEHRFDGFPPEAVDLLTRMLCLDPSQRITAEEALQHAFFSELHDPSDEPICEHPFFIEHEIDNLPVKILKRKILRNTCMSSYEKKSYHSSEENLFKDFDETFTGNETVSRKNRHINNTRHFNSHGEETESSNTNSSIESPNYITDQNNRLAVPMIFCNNDDSEVFIPSLKDAMNHEVLIDEPFRDPGVCERKYHELEVPVKSNIYTETSETSYFSDLSPVINMSEPAFLLNNNNIIGQSFLGIHGRSCADKNQINSNSKHDYGTTCFDNMFTTTRSSRDTRENCEKSKDDIRSLNNEILRSLNERSNASKCHIEALLSDKFSKQADRPVAHWGDSLKFWI